MVPSVCLPFTIYHFTLIRWFCFFYDLQTIDFGNGMVIRWDGVKHVQVSGVPKGSNVCGICGTPGSSDLVIGPYDNSRADDNSGCPNLAASLPVGSSVSVWPLQ